MSNQKRVATSHFINSTLAARYYGCSEQEIREKIKREEISIGKPAKTKDFQEIICDGKGRYWLNSLERIDIKVFCGDGNHFVTGFNGTLEDAENYYLKNPSNDKIKHPKYKFVKVEKIS